MRRCWFAVVIAAMLSGSSVCAAEPVPAPFCLESDAFPIGMYSIDGPAAMERAEGLGIDYVQTYRTGHGDAPELLDRDRAYLDLAQEHGRRVAFQFRGRELAARQDGIEAMLAIIDAVKEHPALAFWIFYDEPEGRHSPEQLLPFYQAAKKAAPHIPFAICHCWKERIADYQNVADLNLNDYYPVQHEPFPQSRLDLMTRFTEQVLAVGRPVIPINQCFNWQAIGRDRKRVEYRGSPVDQMRYPNRAELRYLCYSGLAQGARGMFWWSYAWASKSDPAWLVQEFAPVNREFRDFTRLVAPAHRGDRVATVRTSDVLAASWRRPMGAYWVVVNGQPKQRPLTVETHSTTSATLAPWGSTRDVGATLRKGVLTVESAQPWEVFVWTETKP